MYAKYQRGELSLFWTAIFIGVVALAAMVALMSARNERNYFAEAWKRLTKSQALQQVQQATAGTVKADTAVRKCMIDGKLVYSNVECSAGNPSSRKVDLYDTKGFEAPKMPAAVAPEANADLKEKVIERAVQR